MGNIPYQSQVDSRTGRSQGARLRNGFGPGSMGSRDDGLARAGVALENEGTQIMDKRTREEELEALEHAATYDDTPILTEIQKTVGPDAEEYKSRVETELKNSIESYVGPIENDNVRLRVKERLLQRLPARIGQAAAWQTEQRDTMIKEKTNTILGTLQNQVLSNPEAYTDALTQGSEAVDLYAADASGPAREAMKVGFERDLTRKRFEAKLNNATNIQSLDAVDAEMQGADWQRKLLPKDYEDLQRKIISGRATYRNQVEAEVKSVLGDMETRSKDPTKLIPKQEIATVQQTLKTVQDPSVQRRVARISRDQQIMETARKMTPLQLESTIRDIGTKAQETGKPSQFSGEANYAATMTGVSVPFLLTMTGQEYRPGGPEKNPNSTATGPLQFIEDTWLGTEAKPGMLRDPEVIMAIRPMLTDQGKNFDTMTDEEKLALRSDPQTAFLVGAMLAKRNKTELESYFNAPASDTDLYFAHFLGADGAKDFLEGLRSTPDASAKNFVSEAAYEANKNVFTDKDTGRDYTLAEVYGKRDEVFAMSVNSVDYEDMQVYQNVLSAQKAAQEKGDMLNYANAVGITTLTPMDDPNVFSARPREVERASAYFGVVVPPLTPQEVTQIQQQMNSGSLQEKMTMLDNIASFGGQTARRAFAQLKTGSPALSYAGTMLLQGDRGAAADIVSGVSRMKDNPSFGTSRKFSAEGSALKFSEVMGPAIALWNPADAEAMKQAADALYVETLAVSGGEYSDDGYKDAVMRVGGSSVQSINGYKTLMPRNISKNDIHTLLDNANAFEIASMAVNGGRPMVSPDGQRLTTPELSDVLSSARMLSVGPNRYRLYPPYGSTPYVSSMTDPKTGGYLPYDIEISRDKLDLILKRVGTKVSSTEPSGFVQAKVGPNG